MYYFWIQKSPFNPLERDEEALRVTTLIDEPVLDWPSTSLVVEKIGWRTSYILLPEFTPTIQSLAAAHNMITGPSLKYIQF